jgi:hypothetical protein
MQAVDRYMVHPFHQQATRQWKEINEWVVVDIEE